MDVKIEPTWKKHLEQEFEKSYFSELAEFVKGEYQHSIIYPPPKQIFSAFEYCPFDKVRVVILGQDPYHGPKQANGLCFSVNDGISVPPSLQNIYKEIESDLKVKIPKTGNLERWARQGILLLNATLTVRAKNPGSHQNKGWEQFTDAAIQAISKEKENVIFLLWGAYAQKKGQVINKSKHLILECAHPSPFSADRGFFGCRHFSKANEYLEEHGLETIEW